MAVGVWLLWPRTAITRENGAKLRERMTRAEVVAILGGPERNEGDRILPGLMPQQFGTKTALWMTNTYCVGVDFDDGRVSRIYGGSTEIMKVILAKELGL